MKFIKRNLKAWNKNSFGNIFIRKNTYIMEKLQLIQFEMDRVGDLEVIYCNEKTNLITLHNLIEKEEVLLK